MLTAIITSSRINVLNILYLPLSFPLLFFSPIYSIVPISIYVFKWSPLAVFSLFPITQNSVTKLFS